MRIMAVSLMTSRDWSTSFSTLVLYESNTPVSSQSSVSVVTTQLLSDRH